MRQKDQYRQVASAYILFVPTKFIFPLKSKRKYTHLFFDLDNTLWDFTTNSYYAMQCAFSRMDRQLDKKEFELFFGVYSQNNRLLWDEYRKGNVLKKELVSLRFKKTFDELQMDGIDPLEMNRTYLDEMPLQKRLLDGAEPILGHLKSRGYELYIITNGFTCVQHKKLESSGINKYFKKVFISEEIQSPKPSSKIFEYALKSANAPKTRSLMIGDDYQSDILGALNFGIDAVHLESSPQKSTLHDLPDGNSRNRCYRIQTLAELLTIV